MIATLMNTVNAWSPSNYPFLPASTDTTKVRDMIIESQGNNKRILDIGCGLGYSTSSSEGSLGIDMDSSNVLNAKKLFPNKNFRQSFVNAQYFDEEYYVVTCMFFLNNVPQYVRNKIIDSAIEIAKERVVIVDMNPDYVPELNLVKQREYIPDYIKNCRKDLSLFNENVLVDGLLNIWIYNKKKNQPNTYEIYNEYKLQIPDRQVNNEHWSNGKIIK
jgi:ubiquinone/menaquinone biosynthesis C-methylase UbiE